MREGDCMTEEVLPHETSAHLVQFYDEDEFLLGAIVRFAGSGLGAGESVVVIATSEHLARLEQRLEAHGLDVAGARRLGRYAGFDAAQTLSGILRDGEPDPERFGRVVGGAIRAAAAAGGEARVRAFGEMVALLWEQGKPDAALRLEELWNQLARELPFSVLCAYPITAFRDAADGKSFLRVCEAHSEIIPAESYGKLSDPAERLFAIAHLQQKATVLEDALERSRESAESLSRLAAIVESSDDAIIGKTLDGVVTSWNASAERIFGFTAEEMIGQPISRLIPADHADDFPAILGTLRRGQRVSHYETERLHKDGRRIPVSLTVSPIRDATGRITGASKIARDVSARRLLEAQREQLLGIAQRARAEAEAASRSKDEFLAMLSHELRNPLAALRNAVYSARLDEGKRERALEIASRQTEQLGRLVDDLLDVSRITQGRIRLNKRLVSLTEIVERALETARPLIQERGHSVSLTPPPEPVRVEGDPTRLEQIVGNLLHNAARYTNPGGHLELALERRGDLGLLRVRDDGIGIAPDVMPRIFDLFVQGEREPERGSGGLGIGLAVVRDLAALHGGRIEAHSAGLGKGAEFVLSLPCVDVEPEAEQRKARPEMRSCGGLRVLVVEDNVDAAEGLMMLLEVFGHDPSHASDGAAALAAVQAQAPDLMLVDIGLPELDGYEVARRVRAIPGLRELPLVALTGFGLEEDRRRALSAGFDHHLTKPVDPSRLRTLVARLAGSVPAA